MAFSAVKTWVAGETLTADDLNAEINNIISQVGGLSAFIKTLLDDVDAATARATLGISDIETQIVVNADQVVCHFDTIVVNT